MTHRFTGTLPPDAVPASPGLWVSQDGMVFKAVHNAKSVPMYHVLKAQKDGTIAITTDSGRVKVSAARIVAGAFLSNPEGFSRVHHLDNDPANNAVSNLRWGEAPIEDRRAARRHYYATHKDVIYRANRKYLMNKRCHSKGPVLDSEKYHKDIPQWMIESFQDHESTWVANSRGGEPNHNKDLKIIVPCKEDEICK